MLYYKQLTLLAILLSLSAATLIADEPDPAQAARDSAVVEALLRLENVDVNSQPKLKEAVLRHLAAQKGTERYLELVDRFNLRDTADELLRLSLEQPDSTLGVRAAALLMKFGEHKRLEQAIARKDEPAALAAVSVVGLVGNQQALDILRPLVTDKTRPLSVRSAAARGLGSNRNGESYLLKLAESQDLPADLQFTVANVLFASADPRIRERAARHLTLPATADAKPLPPIAELVGRQGDPQRGRELFNNDKGTCAKCHKVGGTGKDVGPDLSEIGSKLSKEAMYVSILDPSAGISHNYESYTAILDSGIVVTGLLVSETDDAVTLRTAEAIDRQLDKAEIDELIKQKLSLMPADLQKNLTAQDLVDVVEYLTTLKKTDS